MMKPTGGDATQAKQAAVINDAQNYQPKGAVNPMNSSNSSKVGPGGLSGAVAELKTQHPIEHYDHGPHHGTSSHIRHEPVGKVYR